MKKKTQSGKRSGHKALLLMAASESSADMLYFSGLFVPDPFLAISLNGRRIGVLSKLEIARARHESKFDELIEFEPLREEAKHAFPEIVSPLVAMVALLAKRYRNRIFHVPWDFPAGLARGLEAADIKVEPVAGSLFPQREIKTEAECLAIREGNRASEAGLKAAWQVLRQSRIRGNKLIWQGRILTSERLRQSIDEACLKRGAVATRTICAGGDQACDPHCAGSGPLRPDQLIIIDIFPRLSSNGYHGDLSRTFLKGSPNPDQVNLVKTVRKAQRRALAAIRPGVALKTPHLEVERCFTESGYRTECHNDVWQGFFHSTGHGLGLDVHESPRISTVPGKFRSGMVVTVEPGLYYPGLGGCRIEDVVQVVPRGIDYLSRFSYNWIIP